MTLFNQWDWRRMWRFCHNDKINFVGLHTHSLWQTICDAARSSVKILLSKSHKKPFAWQRIPLPGDGTSHGWTWGGGSFSSDLTKNRPPPKNCNFSWITVQGIGVWRKFTISPADTVSLSFCNSLQFLQTGAIDSVLLSHCSKATCQ